MIHVSVNWGQALCVHVAFLVIARGSNLIDPCVCGRIGPIVGHIGNNIVEG